MDLYSTQTLNGIVERMRPVPSFFTKFFPAIITHETEEVYFDKAEDKPRLAPFVHPLREGKLIESLGYKTESVKPAYIKDKRIHDPSKALKRVAGEAFGGSLTNAQRLQALLVQDLADQKKMLARRLEIMAAEAVLSGKQTIIGDGFNAVVDFGRDAELTVVLASTAKWDDAANTDKGKQIEDWDAILLDKSGYNTSHVVMDVKAWKLLKADATFMKLLDVRRGADAISVQVTPMLAMEGVSFKGFYGDFPVFVYSHKYVDPVDGATKQSMPDNTVVMVSKSGLQGVRHFGAIRDLKAGLQAREQFVKSWENEDPSVRYLLSQSAPIMVPYLTNASMSIKVA